MKMILPLCVVIAFAKVGARIEDLKPSISGGFGPPRIRFLRGLGSESHFFENGHILMMQIQIQNTSKIELFFRTFVNLSSKFLLKIAIIKKKKYKFHKIGSASCFFR